MLNRTLNKQDAIYSTLKARGVWKGPNLPFVVLLSAELAELDTVTNWQRTSDLEQYLIVNGVPYKRVLGKYHGETEKSFAVVLAGDVTKREEQLDELLKLAEQFEQDSVLLLDRYRIATLLYPDGRRNETIGTFQVASKHDALKLGDYTYDVDNDLYFIVR